MLATTEDGYKPSSPVAGKGVRRCQNGWTENVKEAVREENKAFKKCYQDRIDEMTES